MKKLMFILIAVFFLGGGIAGCATMMQPHKVQVTKAEAGNYSYEGMVDPSTIVNTWEEVIIFNRGNGWFEVLYKNPDFKARIKVASIIMFQNGFVSAYAYLYGEEVYCFVIDQESNCYKSFETSPELKKQLKQNLLNALNGANV